MQILLSTVLFTIFSTASIKVSANKTVKTHTQVGFGKTETKPKIRRHKTTKSRKRKREREKKQVKHSKLSKLLQLAVSHLLFLLLCF